MRWLLVGMMGGKGATWIIAVVFVLRLSAIVKGNKAWLHEAFAERRVVVPACATSYQLAPYRSCMIILCFANALCQLLEIQTQLPEDDIQLRFDDFLGVTQDVR